MSFKYTNDYSKMPGHWILASLGKTVLRPGGIELTRKMLHQIAINPKDDVVEFAPGLGTTAKITLSRQPKSYTGIEQDQDAAELVKRYLTAQNQTCVKASADQTGLPDEAATVVYGEAMLTMLSDKQKATTIAEAHRILQKDGRYGIHEMCLVPDDMPQDMKDAIQKELAAVIRVNARPLTISEWREKIEQAGFEVTSQSTAPMHLLKAKRMVSDEGLFRTLKIGFNCITRPSALKRVLKMRKTFRKYRKHLGAISLIGLKR